MSHRGQEASAEMPQYQCHKKVYALKISKVKQSSTTTPGGPQGTWDLIPEDKQYGAIVVPHEFVLKNNPQPGGYYVEYVDGYKSYSHAEAFESGYTIIKESVGGAEVSVSEDGTLLWVERYIMSRAEAVGSTFIRHGKKYLVTGSRVTFGCFGGVLVEHQVKELK